MHFVVDVGGTTTRIAVANKKKLIEVKVRFPTPQDFESGMEAIRVNLMKLAPDSAVQGIVLGIPGTIDHKGQKTVLVANLPDWSKRDIPAYLHKTLQVPVKLANDAELAALGEAVFGAGRKYKIVAYITVSTGIGGAFVVDKKLVSRLYNSEPGHMVIDRKSSAMDGSGRRGTLEALASGMAFVKRFGISAKECEDQRIWEEQATVLGDGMINVLLLWSPEILVIGGGLANAGDRLFGPLRKYIKKHLTPFPPPPIVASKWGDDSGLYGGLALLDNKFKA